MLHLAPPHFRPDAGYSGAYNDNSGHGARRRIAEELARRHGLTLLSDWPMPVLGVDCYVMEAPASVAPGQAAELLSRDPRVEWAEPMASYHGLGGQPAAARGDSANSADMAASVRDPLYLTQPSAKFWHIAELHQVTTGRNVRVAVIDSGVEDNHPDLAGQVFIKENFVDGTAYAAESHGTAVAGIIAARAGNGIGIEGVAPGVRLMALRACWEENGGATRCNSFTLGKALNFALMHDAQVINMSLSGPRDGLLRRLIDVALERGVTVVGAVDPQSADGGFPASQPGVIAADEVRARVAGIDAVVAPGRDVPSTAPGGRWALVNGTSFSAAHVSAMAALLVELKPGTRLRRTAFLDDPARDGLAAGRLDACATVMRAAVSGDCACSCPALLASKNNRP
jgi:subtilisin family serine protease